MMLDTTVDELNDILSAIERIQQFFEAGLIDGNQDAGLKWVEKHRDALPETIPEGVLDLDIATAEQVLIADYNRSLVAFGGESDYTISKLGRSGKNLILTLHRLGDIKGKAADIDLTLTMEF